MMNKNKTAPIGIFDSGVGGLTVVREVFRQLPKESFVYYADTAHVPYGPRQPQEIRKFAASITRFLIGLGCKMVIIACNTSTSLAYEELRENFEIPLIGVIEPGVDKALELTRNGRIGVIATEATINSRAYQHMLQKKNPLVQVAPKACPLLVPLIEQGLAEGEEIDKAVAMYLQPLIKKEVDTLILGCTHYPFLLPVIARVMGPSVIPVDPARETVKRVKKHLIDSDLLSEASLPVHRYFASGNPDEFARVGGVFLEKRIEQVEKINLD